MENNSPVKSIINRHALLATGAGFIPIPLLDIAAVTAIQMDMLRQLARQYGQRFEDSKGKAWVTALSGSLVARVGAEAVKLIPGIGSVVGGVSMAALSGGSTYAIGHVVVSHFEKGGTVQDFNPEAYREEFEKRKTEGKEVVEDLQDEQSKAMKKVRELDNLRQDGVLTDEEFQTVKARILAAI